MGARVSNLMDAKILSTGNMLRDALKCGDPSVVAVKETLERGEFAPDELLESMLDRRMAKYPETEILLLDGYPRNLAQAEALERLADRYESEIQCAIFLEAPPEVVMDRLGGRLTCPHCGANYHVKAHPPLKEGICDKCGTDLEMREDDQPETIRHRLDVYTHETAPLAEWYEKAGKLRYVDASGNADAVAEAVIGLVTECLTTACTTIN